MPRKISQGTAVTGASGGAGTLLVTGTTVSTQDVNGDITFSPANTLIVPSRIVVSNTTPSTTTATGALTTTGGVGVAGAISITGALNSTGGLSNAPVGNVNPSTGVFTDLTITSMTYEETSEVLVPLSGATGIVVHDFSLGINFSHTGIAANFTANFTNMPTTDNRKYELTLYLTQGVTGYLATAVQINGASVDIYWAGGTFPTVGSSSFDTQSFTLIRSGAAWTVFSSLNVNGQNYPGSSQTNPAPNGYWIANNIRQPFSLTSATFWIKSATMPNALQMYVDLNYESGGYDFYNISAGTAITKYGEQHSGCALGLDLVYPRSVLHWRAMTDYVRNIIGSTNNDYFQTAYVVYRNTSSNGGTVGGNYSSYIMRNPGFYPSGAPDWKTGDGGRWWLRDSTFTEPNGDYAERNFLGIGAGGYTHPNPYTGQDIQMNDNTAGYSTGTRYLVSTNAKP